MPTGAGKTRTAVELIAIAAEKWGKKIVVVVHTRELRKQWLSAIASRSPSLDVGLIAAGCAPNPYAPVQVAQVQSLAARLKFPPQCDLMVIDEAHHSAAKTYMRSIERLDPAAMLGLSATPARMDGKGLDPPFQSIVHGPEADELIKAGHLNEYKIFSKPIIAAASLPRRAGDYERKAAEFAMASVHAEAIAAWQAHAHNRQTIAFCITRRHGREIADRFRSAGIATAYADGAMQPAMRDRAIADFSSRRAQVICAVDLLGEGVDIPGASCALLLRPTRSVVRHNQAIGRVIRPHGHPSGLSVIVDCVGNCRTLGGPRTDHAWTLDGVDRQRAGNRKSEPAESVNSRKKSAERPIKLIEINDQEIRIKPGKSGWDRQDLKFAKSRCRNLDEMKQLASQLGYSEGWAHVQIRIRENRSRNSARDGE